MVLSTKLCVSRFRRQHEQLQAVIIRVLHLPTAPLQSPIPGADKVFAVEIATAVYTEEGAVHEVHKAYDTMKVVDCLDLTLEGTGAWNTALKRYAYCSGGLLMLYIYTLIFCFTVMMIELTKWRQP